MTFEKVPVVPDPMVVPRPTARTFTTEYRRRIVAEYYSLGKQGKGRLLRREGLYSSLVSQWRSRIDAGVVAAFETPVGRPTLDPQDKQIAELEKKVDRLSDELGKARMVIEVQGKLSALPGEFATGSAG
jgi:transposase